MGITGLWDEVRRVTPGEAIALAQLCADCVREKGRPLRIAVDTPFAVFQYNEATRPVASYVNAHGAIGGMNHPARTLYYHIQHLLRAGIQPLFVYDGAAKPRVKRHKYHLYSQTYTPYEPPAASSLRTGADVAREYDPQHVEHLSKQILDLLGVPWREAPGEAEAECARLERAGVVDAVLTRDGDALAFGADTVLQRLGAEKKAAVVRRFRMRDMRGARPPLRQQDVVLLALMAGGDYHDGVPGCGPKVALEAARVGYGGELQALLRAGRPTKGWRDKLVGELSSQGRFKSRYVAIARAVPAVFPDPKIAGYYFNPAASSREELEEYGRSVDWHKETDVRGLRLWTAKYLDWKYAYHACKFVNNLTPALLARKLVVHSETGVDGSYLIKAIHGEKSMSKQGEGEEANSDTTDEPTLLLRVSYYPATVISIDVSGEPVVEGYKANMEKLFDPQQEAREWFPKWMIESGAPAAFREWQKTSAAKKNESKTPNKRTSTAAAESGEAPTKRPRGRPKRKSPEITRPLSAKSPRRGRIQGGAAGGSSVPSPASGRARRQISSSRGLGRRDGSPRHSHPANEPPTGAYAPSRSSSPGLPDLSSAVSCSSSSRTSRVEISYDASAHGEPRRALDATGDNAARWSSVAPGATPSRRGTVSDNSSRVRAGDDLVRYSNEGRGHLGALEVVDLTSD